MNSLYRILTILFGTPTGVRTTTAVLPLGGYVVASLQTEMNDLGVALLWALVLSIAMQAHRIWFFYNPELVKICGSGNGVWAGEAVAATFFSAIAFSVFMISIHYHIGAEMVMAIQECVMLSIILVALYRVGGYGSSLRVHLANELLHFLVLLWIIYITGREPLHGNEVFHSVSIIVTVLVVNSQYVTHLILGLGGIDINGPMP